MSRHDHPPTPIYDRSASDSADDYGSNAARCVQRLFPPRCRFISAVHQRPKGDAPWRSGIRPARRKSPSGRPPTIVTDFRALSECRLDKIVGRQPDARGLHRCEAAMQRRAVLFCAGHRRYASHNVPVSLEVTPPWPRQGHSSLQFFCVWPTNLGYSTDRSASIPFGD